MRADQVKTSFCLVDSATYDSSLPNYTNRQFNSCDDDEQGVSVGWEDIYFWNLPDQWIDVTGISPGEYWLESEVDPENHFWEEDDTNNVARVKLVIAPGVPTTSNCPPDTPLTSKRRAGSAVSTSVATRLVADNTTV